MNNCLVPGDARTHHKPKINWRNTRRERKKKTVLKRVNRNNALNCVVARRRVCVCVSMPLRELNEIIITSANLSHKIIIKVANRRNTKNDDVDDDGWDDGRIEK